MTDKDIILVPVEITDHALKIEENNWIIFKALKTLTPLDYYWKIHFYEYHKFTDDPLTFFVDGSCLNNAKGRKVETKPAGMGIFIRDYDDRNQSITFEEPLPITNIRAELLVMCKALEMIKDHVDNLKEYKSRGFLIICDSEFAFNVVMLHYNVVQNLDIAEQLIQTAELLLNDDIPFKIECHRGHMKKPQCSKDSKEFRLWYGNKKADELAKEGSRKSKYYKK